MAEKIPIACTLPPDGAAAQIDEWVDLRRFALGAEALPTGARLRFPAELLDRVTDLAEREAACCSFLDIAVDHERRRRRARWCWR